MYEILIERNEAQKESKCILKRNLLGKNESYTFILDFFEKDKKMNKMINVISKNGMEREYNLLGNDIMVTPAIRKEQSIILSEFDFALWIDAGYNETKSALIDAITDVLDINERDNTEIDDKKYDDFELIHSVIKGFFSLIKENIKKVEFDD